MMTVDVSTLLVHKNRARPISKPDVRVSTTPGNTGNLLQFEIPPGNTGNLLEFC